MVYGKKQETFKKLSYQNLFIGIFCVLMVDLFAWNYNALKKSPLKFNKDKNQKLTFFVICLAYT